MKLKKTKLQPISSEEINELNFGKGDVLLTYEDKLRRELKLKKAKDLGNSFLQTKTRFIIKAKSGYKKLTGRVVTFTKQNVILAGQHQIPVSSILDIRVVSV